MFHRASAFTRHQQSRWLRPDAARWVRPDAAKFLKPGTRLDDVYPALMPRRDAFQRKHDREMAEAVAHERSVLAALRAELDAVIAELAPRKTERKYNDDQPRVPAGNGDESGEWASSSGSGRPRVYIYTNPDSDAIGDAGSGSLGINFGNVIGDVLGEVAREIDKLDLFDIKPKKPRSGGVRLAGKPPKRLPPIVVTREKPKKPGAPGIGHNGGPPLEDPPQIPRSAPPKSSAVTAFLRQAANWISRALRVRGPAAVAIYVAELAAHKWLDTRGAEIEPYNDPPKSRKELHDAVMTPRPGTEVHHIAEQTALRNSGYPEEIIDAPENLVRISTLKHYDITLWYRTPNVKFGGLSPRQYLADKPLSERMKVGRDALIFHKVSKP